MYFNLFNITLLTTTITSVLYHELKKELNMLKVLKWKCEMWTPSDDLASMGRNKFNKSTSSCFRLYLRSFHDRFVVMVRHFLLVLITSICDG